MEWLTNIWTPIKWNISKYSIHPISWAVFKKNRTLIIINLHFVEWKWKKFVVFSLFKYAHLHEYPRPCLKYSPFGFSGKMFAEPWPKAMRNSITTFRASCNSDQNSNGNKVPTNCVHVNKFFFSQMCPSYFKLYLS